MNGLDILPRLLRVQQRSLLEHAASAREGSVLLEKVPENVTSWFWAVGVLITLAGATLTAVSLILQKCSHDQRGTDGSSCSNGPYWMQPQWLKATGLFILGNLICWVGMGLAPQSLLACLDCWNIVVSIALGALWLGEPVSSHKMISSSLLLAGCFWVIAAGPRRYEPLTGTDIIAAWQRRDSLCVFGACVAFVSGLGCLSYSRWHRPPAPLTPVQFAALAASFAWYASLLSKSTASLIVASLTMWSVQFQICLFAALLVGFVVFAACQIHFLNMGLKWGNAILVIPVYMALSMTGQIVVGGLFFKELQGLGDYWAHMRFWPGVALVLTGVALLAQDSSPRSLNEKTPLVSGAAETTLPG